MGRVYDVGGVRTLPFFFEGEFALFVVVFVFTSTPVLSSLYSHVLVSIPHFEIFNATKGLCYRTFPLFLGILVASVAYSPRVVIWYANGGSFACYLQCCPSEIRLWRKVKMVEGDVKTEIERRQAVGGDFMLKASAW